MRRRSGQRCLCGLSEGLGGRLGILIETWLKIIALTFLDNKKGTLADVPRLLTDQEFRAPFVANVTNLFVSTYWRQHEKKDGTLPGTEIDSTLRRIGLFLMNSTLTNIVKQEKTTIDFSRFMAEDTICLFKLPVADVGEETAELIGTILLQQLLSAAMGRPRGAKPYFVYADEFQHFITPDIVKIITGARKYGVGITLATQSLFSIHDTDIRTGILAVGNIVSFQIGADDATLLSRELRNPIAPPPKRAISRHPVKHLIEHTHDNEALHGLQERVLLRLERSSHISDWRNLCRYSLEYIDDFFVHVMMGRTAVGSTEEVSDLITICNKLWRYEAHYPDDAENWPPPDLTFLFIDLCSALVEADTPLTEIAERCKKDPLYLGTLQNSSVRRKDWLGLLLYDLAYVHDAAIVLETQPIYADDTPDTTRSDIANALTRLEGLYQRGIAVGKLLSGEYIVQTTGVPQKPAEADPSVIERIRERSLREYCRGGGKNGLTVAEETERERFRKRTDHLLSRYGTRRGVAPMAPPMPNPKPSAPEPVSKPAPSSPYDLPVTRRRRTP